MIYKSIILSFLLLFSFSNLFAKDHKPTLLFYCGITMVKPMKEIAKIIEKKYHCNIKISQGGSKDLYESLKFSKKGDLYLPGSDSYRKNNLKDGLLLESTYIGYNQASIFVQKNNPLNIKDLEDFVNEDLNSILCNPQSGSIGRVTKKIFTTYKNIDFFEEAFDNAVEIGIDSRNINQALITKRVDLAINWKATAFWHENSKYIDVIQIDEKYAPKKKLVINLLKFSKHKDIARDFMSYASSLEGQEIMHKYGFR